MREEFRATAHRLFGDMVQRDLLEAAESGIFPQALWDAVNECGFGLALVPEDRGGIGASLADAAAILQSAGEHAAPGPLLELMLGNSLLASAGLDISSGPLALVFADDLGSGRASRPTMVRNVSWTGSEQQLLVLARSGKGLALAVVPSEKLGLTPEVSDVSGDPSVQARLPSDVLWRELDNQGFDACLRRAALLRSAQMIGGMRWCLKRTTEYTQERKQFGREIGKFQVVQQMMAELASAVVAAHALLDAAIAAPDNVLLVAAARSRIGDAVDTVFTLSHQVHGAIGFSYEYALHFRTRRLQAQRDQFGTVAAWRRTLAMHIAGGSADEVWPKLAL